MRFYGIRIESNSTLQVLSRILILVSPQQYAA